MKNVFLILFFIVLGVTSAAAAPKSKNLAKPNIAEMEKKKNETDFQAAETQLYRQNPDLALPELTRLCNNGYLRACSLLGFGYYSGRYGVKQNTQTGIEWYEKCAQKEKNYFCHKELARIYYRMGDYDKSLHYYKKSAQGGDTDAQYWLGKLYMTGKGLHTNYEKSLKWMRKAAHARKKPSKAARCTLVEMSYFGIGMRRSMKDTKYWLKLCDNPLVRSLMTFYGHGISKDKDKAKEILIQTGLKETLADWNDLNGQPRPSVGKKTVRDQNISEDCLKNRQLFGKSQKIATYAVKIFNPDFYRSFDIHDGYIEKSGIGDQTFEACGIVFYTTVENKRLFNKALKNKDTIKINRYTNACLGSEMIGVCDLNLSWQEENIEEE